MLSKRCQPTIRRSFAAVLLATVGCQDAAGPGVGPCTHEYRSPILEITSAVGSGGTQPVAQLTIRSVTIDGHAVDPASLLLGPSHGVVLWDGVLLCNVPCGFGTLTGRYGLTIEAAGQPTRVVDMDAAYSVFQGGCPSYNDGGTAVRLEF